jgi:hypothetical protein
MTAAEMAAALGDAHREGRAWRCRCPLHGGRSLLLRDGDAGRVLVTCWGGCNRLDILAELRSRGLLDGPRADYRPRATKPPLRRNGQDDDARRTDRALAIWRNTEPGTGSIVERYLRTRGIVLNCWPPSLRFHPRCPRPRDDAGNCLAPLPAMVGLVEHVERGLVAVHATYLKADGSGKADIQKPKAMFGPVVGGAVRLGLPREGQWLAVAEGIETALAVVTACSMPAWSALSAGGIRALMLPPEATHVVICADNDASGTGKRAAQDAAQRWLADNRRMRIATPPEAGTDFADVLAGCAGAANDEARHVA